MVSIFNFGMLRVLIESCILEKIAIAKNNGIRIETTYNYGRKSYLTIPMESIYDIVINETIFNVNEKWNSVCLKYYIFFSLQLKVIYMLVVLTKGTLFKTQPIIPLLSVSMNTLFIAINFNLYNRFASMKRYIS